MSLTELKNIQDIMAKKEPTYGQRFTSADISLLDATNVDVEFGTVNPTVNSSNGIQSPYQVELHVYSDTGGLITSDHNVLTWRLQSSNGTNYSRNILLDIHNDVRNLGFTTGRYKVVYNFLRNFVGSYTNADRMFVSEISPSRRELKLKLTNPDSNESKEQLRSFVSLFTNVQTYAPELRLNFGDDKIVPVISIATFGSETTLLVKLYEPLTKDIDINYACWIVNESMRPYIDDILLLPNVEGVSYVSMRGPNTEVDYDYWTSTETDYKNWNDILGSSTSTSQELLNKYFSGSIQGIDINVDYSELGNFIHFSSAEERLSNFVYKMSLVEYYDTQLGIISSVTGSVGTNRVLLEKNKNRVIGGFDGFESYLYYGISGSRNYTYPGSSSIDPWPKIQVSGSATSSADFCDGNSYYNLMHSTSSVVESWIDVTGEYARDYDSTNIHSLIRSIPEAIKEDSSNDQYVLFVNMIGQHFDIVYSYINALTTMRQHKEHPNDGIPNDLLYDVAKNMGWTLSHGNQSNDLWKYALGLDESGGATYTTTDTGYQSKTGDDRTKEVWRRIVNNLPYILKTKGTSRSVKALLACYGIPSSLLAIREYGGGSSLKGELTPVMELDKYTNFLHVSGSIQGTTTTDKGQRVTIPWKSVYAPAKGTAIYPSAVELRVKPHDSSVYNYQNNNVQTIWQIGTGSTPNAFVTIETTGSIEQVGNVVFALRSSGSVYTSASVTSEYIFDGNPISILVQRSSASDNTATAQTYSLYVYKSLYGKVNIAASASFTSSVALNGSWVFPNTMFIASGSNPRTNKALSGSLFEMRYWTEPLSLTAFENHVLSARAYNGNSPSASFDDLAVQIPFWRKFNAAVTQSIVSHHPNQHITTFSDSSVISASLSGFTTNSFEGTVETYRFDVPSVGANIPYSDKVRIEESFTVGNLSPSKRVEYSSFDKNALDSNRLMVAFSPQHIINEDIYNHIGVVDLDDYIGSPSNVGQEGYPDLRWFSRNYWKKYPNANDFNAYLKLISVFDFSLFKQIEQLLPLRANSIVGLVIEPNVLERTRVKTASTPQASSPSTYNKSTNTLSSSLNLVGSYTKFSGSVQESRPSFDTEVIEVSGDVVTRIVIASSSYDQEKIMELDVPTIGRTATYMRVTGSLRLMSQANVSGSYNYLSTTTDVRDWNRASNRYEYVYTTSSTDYGYGRGWEKRTVAYWKIESIMPFISSSRYDGMVSTKQYFFSSSLDIVNDTPYSSSLRPTAGMLREKLPQGIKNARYYGCKISAAGVNEVPDNSFDNTPVVEIITTDGTQLIVTDYSINGTLTSL